MKRLVCAIVAVLLATAVFGADKASFDDVVDFESSLESIATQARRAPDQLLENTKVFVIDGVVAAVNVVDPNPESFRAELDLVTGEWIGLERIVMYKAAAIVEGAEFAPRIPTRRSREEPPGGTIERNQRVIVVGTIAGIADDPETGRPIPVLDVFYVRNQD
jgi:hypothetical protein